MYSHFLRPGFSQQTLHGSKVEIKNKQSQVLHNYPLKTHIRQNKHLEHLTVPRALSVVHIKSLFFALGQQSFLYHTMSSLQFRSFHPVDNSFTPDSPGWLCRRSSSLRWKGLELRAEAREAQPLFVIKQPDNL